MSLQRRDFIKGLATLAAAQAVPLAAFAATNMSWTLGFAGLREDQPTLDLQVEGTIPAACHGSLYRNGPALYSRGAQRYGHWFDPDGMIQHFKLSATGVKHSGRFVRTRRFEQESAAGGFLYGGAGTNFPAQQPVRSNETTNVANINVQPLGGELLALWEAGSAYRIDPETLETLGQRHWSPELAGVPFSAHPRFDEQGHMWNIGSVPFVGRPALMLYHISPSGQLLNSRLHRLDFPGYMHDFILTPRYVLALNSSAVFREGENFVDRMHWEGSRPSQLLVFDRNDLSLVQTIEVPATFVFHFGNAWEDAGRIVFTACAHPDSRIVTEGMHLLAQQRSGDFHHRPRLVRYEVSLSRKTVDIHALDIDMEFPGFDRRQPFTAQRIYGASGQEASPSSLATGVIAVDPRSGDSQVFDYGPTTIVEEPVFVPSGERTSQGYLLHTYLDHENQRSGLSVFDAARIGEGPIAKASMPRILPLGFHGCFLSQRA